MIKTLSHILIPQGKKRIGSLLEYIAEGGLGGLNKARSLKPAQVIQHVKISGLRGRGGYGLWTSDKWEALYRVNAGEKYVICNAAECEPGTYKDRFLINKNPYQLLEGILIACYALDARGAVIGIKQKYTVEVNVLNEAIRELEDEHLLLENFIEIYEGPDEYLLGEETALLEAIDGGRARPRGQATHEKGIKNGLVSSCPCVVHNVETLSNLPQIFMRGAHWFKEFGTGDTSGTIVSTVTGDVQYPGLFEIDTGISLRTLLYDYCRGPKEGRRIKGVLSGVSNAVITPDQFDTPLDYESMNCIGSGLGTAGFIVYDDSACMVKVALLAARFLSMNACSCDLCLPGITHMTQWLEHLEEGKGSSSELEQIRQECERVTRDSLCDLPVRTSKLIPSLIHAFADEFRSHLGHPCKNTRSLTWPQIRTFDEEAGMFIMDNNAQQVK